MHIKQIASAVLLALVLTCGVYATSAEAATPLIGWAWSDNIGWISFSSANAGAGSGTYSVMISTSTTPALFSGYAWSDNIGWISFDPNDLEADPPCYDPENSISADPVHAEFGLNEVTGWVRAVAGIGRYDGWDGCVKLSDSSGVAGNYPTAYADGSRGVSVDVDSPSTLAHFLGFAWGGDVLGWVRFSPTVGVNDVRICLNPGVGCGGSVISGGTCTLNGGSGNVSIAEGGSVTTAVSGVTGGGGPYTYSWNANYGSATYTTKTQASTGITYPAGSGGTSYSPYVVVGDSGHNPAIQVSCPTVVVTAPTSNLSLKIGATGPTANSSAYTVRRGSAFGLKWVNNLDPLEYNCSQNITNGGTWTNWGNSPSGNANLTTPTSQPTGAYVFSIQCTPISSAPTVAPVSATLNVTKSVLEEI